MEREGERGRGQRNLDMAVKLKLTFQGGGRKHKYKKYLEVNET